MPKVTNIVNQRKREIIENINVELYKRIPRCPFCGEEDDIERDCFDADDDMFPKFRVPVECETCGKKWYEIYDLDECWICNP